MSTTARRRLMRDFKRLQEDPPEGVSGAPGENNIMVWNAVIFGPHETPFEDGTFKLMVRHHTEWKFQDFYVIKILREMNFGESRSCKTADFCDFRGTEFL